MMQGKMPREVWGDTGREIAKKRVNERVKEREVWDGGAERWNKSINVGGG